MNIENLRHSTSHIMAQAVKRLFPEVKLAIGPSISDGFYYDFDLNKPLNEEDILKIEEEMKKIIKEEYPFVRKEIKKVDAIKFFKEKGEIYKVEILNEIKEDVVAIYEQGEFVDLCKGPHVNTTSDIKVFKLLSIAGAYWRGDEKNKMLQRIYGTAFETSKELDEYMVKLEEAKKRDHRKLGTELDLYSIHDEVGAGLIHWHPKGAMIRMIIEDFWKMKHIKNGYKLVNTPHIASEQIYKISGHLEKFSEMIYSPMDIEGKPFRVKPMNCPNHIMIYKTRLHSYRELPLRFAEMGTVYRFEKSGVLHGLLRVRGFTIDDAHIFCREEQLEEEMLRIFDFTMKFLNTFGFSEYEIYLATKPEKYVGGDEIWEKATNTLKLALEKTGYNYKIDEAGGAFYGPKVDIKVKDSIGRLWQCSTIQFDFNLPERFDIRFRDESGKDKRVVMIHRALLGSLERFFGVLIENYGGAFPVWLSPVQVKILTITNNQDDYATALLKKLEDIDLRAEMDLRSEKIGAKIREATLEKIPYMIIIGEKEVKENKVAVRKRAGGDLGSMEFVKFLDLITEDILKKR
ncbi:MAG: threonine--tRNA ligase [Candidatus Firestonebacteria bacterium]